MNSGTTTVDIEYDFVPPDETVVFEPTKEEFKDKLKTDAQGNGKLQHKVYKCCLEPSFCRRNPSYGSFIIRTRW